MEWWEEKYAEALDEDGTVTVAGLEFDPSRVVRECDPIAFQCGANDYADAMGWDTDADGPPEDE